VKLGDAKKFVAAYLVGEPVSHADLQDACDTLNRGDREYTQFLEEELGLPGEPYSLCEVFSERAAEFSEMTENERREEMLELVEHLTICRDCQAVYRELYMGVFASSVGWAGTKLRRLGEPLRLIVNWAGKLSESGLGPVALTPRRVVATHLGPTDVDRKEWEIRLDEESDVSLRLKIAGNEAGPNVGMNLELSGFGAKKLDGIGVQVEWYKRQGDLNVLKGTDHLHAFRIEPLVLEAGSWSIRLVSGGVVWEIPLILDREN
jgi:hypothetical protein